MDCKTGLSRFQVITIALITILALALGVIIGHFLKNDSKSTLTNEQKKVLLLSLQAAEKTYEKPILSTKVFIVAKGETLSHIFQRAQLPDALLLDVSKLPIVSDTFITMQPGQPIKITTDLNNHFVSLDYTMDQEKSLLIQNQNNHLTAKIIKKPQTKALQFKSATIYHSLTEAAIHAGITPTLLTQIKQMFAGSINFSRDIRSGDKIKILYEEYYVDGKKEKPGNVVAAELDTHNKKYSVVRFTEHHHTGYYTTDGHAVASLFLKFPLIYKRISSYFNYHRLDPILHRIHPHLGVDLAAPRGTPVKAIGSGHILLRGWVHGYGNTVIIQYNKTYKTLYGHLEKFAKGLKVHQYVKKGQVVGYVGSTGWSTGPHLHFEVYKNGKPTNPLTLHFPHSPPIPAPYHHTFKERVKKLFTQMHLFDHG